MIRTPKKKGVKKIKWWKLGQKEPREKFVLDVVESINSGEKNWACVSRVVRKRVKTILGETQGSPKTDTETW